MMTVPSRHFLLARGAPPPRATARAGALAQPSLTLRIVGRTVVCFSDRLRSVLAFALLAIFASDSALFACPVCFGQSDSPMAKGMNLGILFLLGVTGVVLASFAAFFIYLMRRARLVQNARLRTEDPLTCSNS